MPAFTLECGARPAAGRKMRRGLSSRHGVVFGVVVTVGNLTVLLPCVKPVAEKNLGAGQEFWRASRYASTDRRSIAHARSLSFRPAIRPAIRSCRTRPPVTDRIRAASPTLTSVSRVAIDMPRTITVPLPEVNRGSREHPAIPGDRDASRREAARRHASRSCPTAGRVATPEGFTSRVAGTRAHSCSSIVTEIYHPAFLCGVC